MLTEPIVEGAWYVRSDFSVGPAVVSGDWYEVLGDTYYDDGAAHDSTTPFIVACIGYVVPTDPAEVVAELRRVSNLEHEKAKVTEPGNSDYHAGIGYGLQDAADLVAAKLGVK